MSQRCVHGAKLYGTPNVTKFASLFCDFFPHYYDFHPLYCDLLGSRNITPGSCNDSPDSKSWSGSGTQLSGLIDHTPHCNFATSQLRGVANQHLQDRHNTSTKDKTSALNMCPLLRGSTVCQLT